MILLVSEIVTRINNSSRYISSIVGIFFILFGLVIFFASFGIILIFLHGHSIQIFIPDIFINFYEIFISISKIIEPQTKVTSLIALFIKVAEYYLLSITFVFVGRELIQFQQIKPKTPIDLKGFEEKLFTMIVSVSSVMFLSVILDLNTVSIDSLYLGLAVASVILALGGYIYLTKDRKKEDKIEISKKEEEKDKKEEELTEEELDGPPALIEEDSEKSENTPESGEEDYITSTESKAPEEEK